MRNDLRKNRISKLEILRKEGVFLYPERVSRDYEIADVLKEFLKLSRKNGTLSIVGRIMAVREHGGSTFVDLRDGTDRIQCYFKKDILKKAYDLFLNAADTGDIISVSGRLFKTKRGEMSVEVKKWTMLTKTLLPFPEKWHGLKDVEERYRKRYLDLLFNEDAMNILQVRSRLIDGFRSLFHKEGFIEVETPILQSVPGGALAKPFKTHLNALNLDFYLRIAPELYLKRLLVGGFEKIFEIGRAFRNEGMDRTHNPEFTILELYWAYQEYEGLMNFVEDTIKKLVKMIHGGSHLTYGDEKVNVSGKWPRLEYTELIKKYANIDYFASSKDEFLKAVKNLNISVGKSATKGELADEIFKKIVLPDLSHPTFVINHPIDISPLAKRNGKDPHKASRFQLVIAGLELVNGFSELNDPQDQLKRFQDQEKLKRAGGSAVHPMDKDFVEALEYGMPPAAGLGIGVDRLVMLFTNSHSIREVIPFPTMKPREPSQKSPKATNEAGSPNSGSVDGEKNTRKRKK